MRVLEKETMMKRKDFTKSCSSLGGIHNMGQYLKHKKKFNMFVLVLVLCLQQLMFPGSLVKAEQITSNMDMVLVLDASKSMNKTDPERLSTEAMKMFIDMGHVSGDKIGMVAYSDSIVKEANLADIKDTDDKQNLKNMLSSMQLGNWTDIGLGLKRAVEMLDSGHDNTHKPLIVLLSDGKNDPSRDKAASESDLNSALALAKSKNYPVYTIGLNADGTVDKAQLEKIAKDTNAKTFVTNTANDLPKILQSIFADNSKLKVISGGTVQANGDYQDVKVSIPDSNVVEANISMLSQNPVEVKIYDPSSKEVAVNSGNVYFSSSKKYSMVKIINPAKGDWLLKVKGVAGDKIDISLVFNYDLQVTMNLEPNNNLHKNDKVKISSFVMSDKDKLQDSELYKSSKAVLLVKDLNSNETKEVALESKDLSFEGEYTIPGNSKYELKVKVEGPGFYRESEAITIGGDNRPPVVSNKLEDMKISTKSSKEIDLNSVFTDPDKDTLNYTVSSDKNIAAGTINGSKLILSPVKKGTTEIAVTADDGKGGTVSQTFQLKVTSILPLILIIAAVLLFIIAIVVLKVLTGGPNLVGEIKVQVEDETAGISKSPQFRRLGTFGKKASVHNLMQLDPKYNETEKIVLSAGKDDTLIVKNGSPCTIKDSYGRIVNASKGITLKHNERIKIYLTKCSESIEIQFYNS